MKNAFKLDKLILLLIPLGVAINFAGSNILSPILQVVRSDSIGTILIGAMGGADSWCTSRSIVKYR